MMEEVGNEQILEISMGILGKMLAKHARTGTITGGIMLP
jgi:hypothetical protein